MAQQVTAYIGFKGQLYHTEASAEASFKSDKLRNVEAELNGRLKHAIDVAAYSPVGAMEQHRPLVEEWLALHKELYPRD